MSVQTFEINTVQAGMAQEILTDPAMIHRWGIP